MYICDKTIENNNIINTKVYMLNSKSARVNQYYKQLSKWNEKLLVSSSKSTPFKQSNE